MEVTVTVAKVTVAVFVAIVTVATEKYLSKDQYVKSS